MRVYYQLGLWCLPLMSKVYEVHYISSPRAVGSLDWLLQWPRALTPIWTGLELNISKEHLTVFRGLRSQIITLQYYLQVPAHHA